jgi:hypothetical protein
MPLWQVVPLAHARPQAPQLALSDARVTQAPPQSVWPAPHMSMQAPLVQT